MGAATNLSSAVTIEDVSAVGEARRRAHELVANLGFGPTEIGKVALVATELAGNIVKHAGRGEILLRGLTAASRRGVEVIALDRGPGMSNIAECLRDGYSTAGSPGTGLGAVRRISETFEIYSGPTVGTANLARLWSQPAASDGTIDVGVVCAPKRGEKYCGDNWAVKDENRRVRVLIADGLGHGPQAAGAANAAVAAFADEKTQEDLPATLAHLHAALRRTRGAAAAIAEIDFARGLVRYAGVGNISACIVSPAAPDKTRRLISQNGILGVEMRKVQEFSYPLPEGSCLIMHSDGLISHWQLALYPGLLARDPALIAAVLYRDHRRGSDDVSVLVARKAARH
jgi:anti-sigma regulatory factor (Ser/Thr protein kinase)